ncbi:hypothetical protein ACIPY3_21395 [Paenarthrobacter sp. NPDC089714]|uniref:hypothetical protein n=1 Tax=Paenarthrobacter sp. NPDC089714 TaxID=3364377 RepID=UPI0037FAE5FB
MTTEQYLHLRWIDVQETGSIEWVETSTDTQLGLANHSALRRGTAVRLLIDGILATGVIDDVTTDGTMSWIWLDGGLGRRLLDNEEAQIVSRRREIDTA